MSIFIGNKEPKEIYIGNKKVKAVYKGSNMIWTSASQEYTLTLDITTSGKEDGSAGFILSDNNGKAYEKKGKYSLPYGTTLTLSLWSDEGYSTAKVNDTDYSATTQIDIDVTSDITIAIHIVYVTEEENYGSLVFGYPVEAFADTSTAKVRIETQDPDDATLNDNYEVSLERGVESLKEGTIVSAIEVTGIDSSYIFDSNNTSSITIEGNKANYLKLLITINHQ